MAPHNNGSQHQNNPFGENSAASTNITLSGVFAGMAFYRDHHTGIWIGDMPPGRSIREVDTALSLLMIRYPNLVRHYEVNVRASGGLTVTVMASESADLNHLLIHNIPNNNEQAMGTNEPVTRQSAMPASHTQDSRLVGSHPPKSSDRAKESETDTLALSTRPPAPVSSISAPPLSTDDVARLLSDPTIQNDPRIMMPSFDARKVRLITTVFNAIRPRGSLINAIALLEAAGFIPALAVQFWRQYLHNCTLPPTPINLENERLDRMPANAGVAFDNSKLFIEPRQGGRLQTSKYVYNIEKYGSFNQYSIRDILRLNRQRAAFITKHLGLDPTTNHGAPSWHPIEKYSISEQYRRRSRHAPGFPDYRAITADHNAAFKDFVLPGWGTVAKQRDSIDQVMHRWWLSGQKGQGLQKHKNAQEKVKSQHKILEEEMEKRYEDSLKFDESLEPLEEDEAEARAEEEEEEEKETGKVGQVQSTREKRKREDEKKERKRKRRRAEEEEEESDEEYEYENEIEEDEDEE